MKAVGTVLLVALAVFILFKSCQATYYDLVCVEAGYEEAEIVQGQWCCVGKQVVPIEWVTTAAESAAATR